MSARVHPGRVDPRFPGLTVRATSPAERDSFLVTDRRANLPPRILDKLADDQFVADVARATVLDHELRHFHDLLLTPLGGVAVCTRLYAACNAFIVALQLRERGGGANVLPVPLQDWLHLTLREREDYLDQQSAYSGRPLSAPSMPMLDPHDDLDDFAEQVRKLRSGSETSDHFLLACRAALSQYRLYDQLWSAPRDGVRPLGPPTTSFWEAPALLCQVAALSERSGQDSADRLLRWMVRHGPSSYRDGLELVTRCAEALHAPPYALTYLSIATWSQLGPYNGDPRSLPLTRLQLLANAGHGGLRWRDDTTFLDQVAQWDDVVGSATVDNLHAETGRLERSFASLRAQGLRIGELIAPAMDAWLAAHHAAKAVFLADPDAYVDPVAYLESRGALPRPAVAVAYDDPVAATSDLQDATPLDWRPAVAFEDAIAWASMVEATDALFLPGDRTLQPNGRRIVHKLVNLEPLRVIR